MNNINTIKVLTIESEKESLLIHQFIENFEISKFEINNAKSIESATFEANIKKFNVVLMSEEYIKNSEKNRTSDFINAINYLPLIVIGKKHQNETESKSLELGASDYITLDKSNSFHLQKSIRTLMFQSDAKLKLKENEIQIIIKDRLSSMKILASSLAHEIGTPLGVIRGRAEYIIQKNKNDDFLKKNLDIVISQSDRISHLINSLLNLSIDKTEKSSAPKYLNVIINDVNELLDAEMKKHNISFINEVDKMNGIEISPDFYQLHQVILNIVVNSIQAIRSANKNGQNRKHFIHFSARLENNFCCLSIQDSGCGISEKNIRNIFDPFFSTQEIGQGIGLGLTISHRIIDSWGGKIQITSKINEGSKTTVFIPINK